MILSLLIINTVLITIVLYIVYKHFRSIRLRFLLKRAVTRKFNYSSYEFIANDPHHGGRGQWMIKNGKFYHKPNGGAEKWTPIKKMSLTAPRIVMMYHLLQQANIVDQ